MLQMWVFTSLLLLALAKGLHLTVLQDDGKANEDKGEVMYPEDEMMPFEEDEKPEAPKLSKKARKARDKLSVAELKVRLFPSLPLHNLS